ncbi:NADH-ubiquinone oxidoreductase 21 kDa subunit [Ceratocystis lukuohia]|uniref:NADH dehydrogenase [ubiquinone] iron-sulfur protein 4, mitochondrial n=3 Tax=Ceratocystis TaxID=5157 RepID=A0A0F8DM23_CERFI|nr:NADH-ubiquinone oxidoreductase 21 kDa subunit mitochondrial [Ceratocystis platani]PHH55627.1 NADH-ubiquinone oxidoreductase 21 kDa subunit, mitochondrial [Ceratocystis fimbriata CBS 114723]
MSSMRTSSVRVLRSAVAPTARSFSHVSRLQQQKSVTTTNESVTVAVPASNQPDYTIEPDKATSTFTPVPKRIQVGNENIPVSAAISSGAPIELQGRQVRIYQESKPATQSGDWKGHHWRMDWDVLGKGHRWENPLMGWQSSADAMQGTRINFETKEAAIRFAEKQGYEYFVQEPQRRRIVPKSYADNFLYSAKELKHVRTK